MLLQFDFFLLHLGLALVHDVMCGSSVESQCEVSKFHPHSINHLKSPTSNTNLFMLYMGFELGFNLNFWNVIPSILNTQTMPQTLNKYPQTLIPNLYKHVLNLLLWYMCPKQISFVFFQFYDFKMCLAKFWLKVKTMILRQIFETRLIVFWKMKRKGKKQMCGYH